MSSAANAVAWQWCGESDEFEPFSDSHCATIEAAYQRQGKRALDVKLTIGRHSYRIRHSLKVVGWIRKQFEEPDAVYVQQRVGEASLWRQVQRVGTDESEGEEEQHQGRQAQDRKQAVRPRREAPPSSSSGASTSAAGESAPSASASAGSEGAPGHRPMEVDGRSAAASTGAGASTADPSGLEGCLVRSMLNALSWVRHSSPPHASWGACASWGCHGWLWVALRTLKERPCCSRRNKRPRHGQQPQPTLQIPRLSAPGACAWPQGQTGRAVQRQARSVREVLLHG